MTREEISKAIEEMEQELARREQLATDTTALEDVASSFIQISQSLAQLRGVSQNEIIAQYLPREFIEWVVAGNLPQVSAPGDWVQPTSADTAYNKGNRAVYDGVTYISLEDNNRYSPQAYPQGWKAV